MMYIGSGPCRSFYALYVMVDVFPCYNTPMNTSIPIPAPLAALGELFAESGHRLYGVGGIVRNALLGVPPSDLDVASGMLPEEVLSLCERHGIRCIPKALKFGTVEIHTEGLVLEHTTFRGGERYPEGGAHRPEAVDLGADLTADAFRRDFTCNALYVDVLTGEILDPTGGISDIEARILRATSPDPSVILRDDGLRVLRLVRFAAELGFMIGENTFAAARDCAGGLADIAWERKRDELTKILLSDSRYPTLAGENAVLRALETLHALGALPHLLPELLEGEHIPQRAEYHRYPVMAHNFHACAAIPADLTLRLAALLHDVGKPAAIREKGLPADAGAGLRPTGLPKGITPMLGHDALGADMAESMLARLRYPTVLIEETAAIIRHHMYDLGCKAKETTLRARFAEWGYDHVLRVAALREADVRGSGYVLDYTADRWREILARMKAEGAPFSESELQCTGKDIMDWLDLLPGPQVGQVKHRLLLHCARHPRDNQGERLRRIAKGML